MKKPTAHYVTEGRDLQQSGMFPIRTVSELTGVNPITLRAWERRYGLVVPERTPKGHRLYTREDIERINRVTVLLDQGIAISQVKPLLDQPPGTADGLQEDSSADVWNAYQLSMLQAIRQFDQARLDSVYNDALSLYPLDVVSKRLLAPLLKTLGQQWQHSDSGIAQEHFFSVYLRNKIGARILHLVRDTSGPKLLVACLPGEQHETGMLLFALALQHYGYQTLVLGANLPLDQVLPVLKSRSCDAIVLSGFSQPAHDLFTHQLPKLVSAVRVPVFVGGTLASEYKPDIEATGAIYAGTEIETGLRVIAGKLRR